MKAYKVPSESVALGDTVGFSTLSTRSSESFLQGEGLNHWVCTHIEDKIENPELKLLPRLEKPIVPEAQKAENETEKHFEKQRF